MDNLDNLDHLDYFDHHIHLNHLEHLDNIFWADCANFLPMKAKPCFFCILLCKMGDCVSLRGDITHFVLMIHALLTQILKHCNCANLLCVKNIA